ncbi:MAG: AAA family ATPase [Bacteroidota bacterium]|nr:AAA family ATPase [Bacteroidota bacterium]
MFKLLKVEFDNHPILKNLKLEFVSKSEIDNETLPYTTVIIGPNGTGKSYILKTIAEIFTYFKDFQKDPNIFWLNKYGFSLEFKIDKDLFEIRTGRFKIFNKRGEHRKVECLINKPADFEDLPQEKKDFFIENATEILLPERILVSSVMLTDRFIFRDSNPDDFYQYLGVRRNRSTSSTQTFEKKTIKYLFDAARTKEFKNNLLEILNFMGLEEKLTISYSIKYKNLFEKQKPSVENFHLFFNTWWEVTKGKRNKENKPWGLWYYEKIKNDKTKITNLLELLNKISEGLILKKESKRAKEFVIDVFDDKQIFESYSLIEELIFLDLLRLEGIKIKKKETDSFGVQNSSSGEYHLLISLLGIFSRIQSNSIVLIDEPETSLHPNWQMRYINELKKMFKKYADCHFILASHSHFIISDLENTSSSVLALRSTENVSAKLLKAKTYGWSAEEVLYEVFKVRTTRNSFLEYDLTKLISMVNKSSAEFDEIRRILLKVENLVLNDSDPLKIIIEKVQKYLIENNA